MIYSFEIILRIINIVDLIIILLDWFVNIWMSSLAAKTFPMLAFWALMVVLIIYQYFALHTIRSFSSIIMHVFLALLIFFIVKIIFQLIYFLFIIVKSIFSFYLFKLNPKINIQTPSFSQNYLKYFHIEWLLLLCNF